MKKEYSSRSVFFGPRRQFGFLPCSVFLALFCCGALSNANASVQASTPAESQLSAILLPVAGDSRTSQLAVSWRGEAGARLRASLISPGQPETVLVQDRPLEAGVSLSLLPLDRSDEGRLHLEVLAADGTVLESGRYPIAALFGSVDGAAWDSEFFGPGLDNNVIAAVVWDDGNGPALYVGGLFFSAGKSPANSIARWDGSAWSTLDGPGATGVEGSVLALTVYDGALIAGGAFNKAGGVSANNIARWDGREWSAVGTGTSGLYPTVLSLTEFRGSLIAAGAFTEAGGVTVNGIASWNGSEWSALNTGVEAGTIYTLTVYNNALIAAGLFDRIGGVNANRIARWNGRGWSPLGSGLGDMFFHSVHALTVYNGGLIAGGSFPVAGGQAVNNIARWDGSSWSPLGLGVTGGDIRVVYALSVLDGALLAGGGFTVAGTTPVHNIARWNGSAWSALTGSAEPLVDGVDNQVRALTVLDGRLMVGGQFTRAEGGTAVNRIARWDGNAWSALGSPGAGLNGDVFALTVYNGALIVGGRFTQAGATITNNIASWDGHDWKPVDGPSRTGGVNDIVTALTVYNGQLIAGGFFTEAGGVSANRIALWNGSAWWPLGTGTNSIVRALTVSGGDLIAGGEFTQAGGVNAARIARWDGRRWSPLGSGISGAVDALTVYHGELIAAGQFLQAGGKDKNNIARWDGHDWAPLKGPSEAGVNASVRALTVFDGRLIAGGAFTEAGGIPASRIASWDGQDWAPLASEVSGGCCDPLVHSLTVFDNALIAGGVFRNAGAETVNFIARWDGSAWSALSGPSGTGMRGASLTSGGVAGTSVRALTAFDADGPGPAPEKLAAGGDFSLSGGIANWGIALYRPIPATGPQ